jgi:hypothetical protein
MLCVHGLLKSRVIQPPLIYKTIITSITNKRESYYGINEECCKWGKQNA